MEKTELLLLPRHMREYLSVHGLTDAERREAYALMVYPLFRKGEQTKEQLAEMLDCTVESLEDIYRENGLSLFPKTVLTIDEIKQRVIPILKRESVTSAWLFGSYARGEATPNSDIDLRVDCRQSNSLRGLIQIAGFREELAERLGKDVDLITKIPMSEFSKSFRENLKKEEILIYDHAG
ncbi:MAG: nucleotidyltransferase domain-containing protein [Selenomonadaceae bacterium]|nr:nucleotidyltransferase domain-containing protein [Selenomonadaceae bacterium]